VKAPAPRPRFSLGEAGGHEGDLGHTSIGRRRGLSSAPWGGAGLRRTLRSFLWQAHLKNSLAFKH
jgi:hypothetical protein